MVSGRDHARPDPNNGESESVDPDEAKRLVQAEKQEYEEDARRAREDARGLLAFVDEDLANEGVVMPVFDDPLKALRYVAGAVETRRTAQDIRHRRKLIKYVRTFAAVWILAVLVIVVLSAVDIGFHVADQVLIALVTTTTANVLGLAYIVLRGMFDRPPPDHTPGAASKSTPSGGA